MPGNSTQAKPKHLDYCGREMTCQRGADGVHRQLFAAEIVIHREYFLRDGQAGVHDEEAEQSLPLDPDTAICTEPKSAARSHPETDNKNEFDTNWSIEFIHFRKVHRYSKSDYPDLAPRWREKLAGEGAILYTAIKDARRDYQEYLDARGFYGRISQLVGLRAFAPSIEPFDVLLTRVDQTVSTLSDPDYDYETLHEAGLEFQRIWETQDNLMRDVFAFHEDVTRGAERSEAGATLIEDTAFQVLDAAAKARAMGNPVQEAAYRIGVLALRLLGRAGGELSLADAETLRTRMWKQLKTTLDKGVPPIMTDFCLNLAKGRLDKLGDGRGRKCVESIIRAILGFSFDVAEDFIHDVAITRDSLAKHAEDQVVNAVSEVVGILIGESKTGNARYIARMVVESGISVVGAELLAAQREATEKNTDRTSVFLANLPGMIVKMAQAMFVKLATGKLEKMAKAEAAAKKTDSDPPANKTDLDADSEKRKKLVAIPFEQSSDGTTSRPSQAEIRAASGPELDAMLANPKRSAPLVDPGDDSTSDLRWHEPELQAFRQLQAETEQAIAAAKGKNKDASVNPDSQNAAPIPTADPPPAPIGDSDPPAQKQPNAAHPDKSSKLPGKAIAAGPEKAPPLPLAEAKSVPTVKNITPRKNNAKKVTKPELTSGAVGASAPPKTLLGRTTTSQFKRAAEAKIRSTPDHPLKKLLGSDGRFSSQTGMQDHPTLMDHPELLQMMHTPSDKSGGRPRIVLGTAYNNQFDAQTVERSEKKGGPGGLTESAIIDIGGIGVEVRSARDWLAAKIITQEAFDSAKPVTE